MTLIALIYSDDSRNGELLLRETGSGCVVGCGPYFISCANFVAKNHHNSVSWPTQFVMSYHPSIGSDLI